jgi:small subunit ribosomal protein S2
LIVGKLADAIYEGRHGQPDVSDDYEEFDEALDIDAEDGEALETVENEAVASPEPETVAETTDVTAEG